MRWTLGETSQRRHRLDMMTTSHPLNPKTRLAAARRAIRARWASMDVHDEEFILPLPTDHEAPSNHLSGRRRKTTLVLVVIFGVAVHCGRGSASYGKIIVA
jgi:hypothetical protein